MYLFIYLFSYFLIYLHVSTYVFTSFKVQMAEVHFPHIYYWFQHFIITVISRALFMLPIIIQKPLPTSRDLAVYVLCVCCWFLSLSIIST